MRVYVLEAVIENGRRFEGDSATTVFDSLDKALAELQDEVNDYVGFLEKYYDEDDIRVEWAGNDYVVIDADNYSDCVTLSVIGTDVK